MRLVRTRSSSVHGEAPLTHTIAAMTAYEARVSQDTISALKTLIGRQVHTIYAPVLAVAGAHLAAPSFAISISEQILGRWVHRFLNLKAVWSETPRFMNDLWELQAFEGATPLGISTNAENAMVSPCSIHFYENGGSEVTTIRVYTLSAPELADASESVVYDKVIQFVRANGSSFCIACQLDGPGIAEDVHLTEDPVLIGTFVEGCHQTLAFP